MPSLDKTNEYKFDKNLKDWFANIYRFCNNDIHKLFLMLRKGVYPFEYIRNWERFNETQITPKDKFYSNLDVADMIGADHKHGKRVWKGVDINNLVSIMVCMSNVTHHYS